MAYTIFSKIMEHKPLACNLIRQPITKSDNMRLRDFIIANILFFSILFYTACSDSSTTSSVDQYAEIHGTVEGGFPQAKMDYSESNTESKAVWAAAITSGGSIEKISETETQVDASGRFTVNVDANQANRVVIVAESEGRQMTGFIAAEIENGKSFTLKPVNIESTAETAVYTRIISEGKSNLIHKSDIETLIRANSAADIHASGSVTNQVAAAIIHSAEARAEFLSEYGSSDVQTLLNNYFELMTEAQLDYEAAVSSSTSSDARNAAFDAYLHKKFDSYHEAGVDLAATAKMTHMQAIVVQNTLGSVSAGVRNTARSSQAFLAAIAIDAVVKARAEASGMSQSTVSAISDAGSVLKAEVRSSNGAEASVKSSFKKYHEDVRTAIENDSSVEASIIIAIDTEINSVGGAKFLFSTSLSGLLDASSLLDVYGNFAGSVRNSVEAQSDLIGDVNTDALADIMILINLF